MDQIVHIWNLFFQLPDGAVWPNIVASGLTFGGGWLWSNRHHKKRHAELQRSLDSLHEKIDRQRVDDNGLMI